MVRHWTPKQAIISCIRSSPTGGNFLFAVVNSFEYNNAISTNFVHTVKNSIGSSMSPTSENCKTFTNPNQLKSKLLETS